LSEARAFRDTAWREDSGNRRKAGWWPERPDGKTFRRWHNHARAAGRRPNRPGDHQRHRRRNESRPRGPGYTRPARQTIPAYVEQAWPWVRECDASRPNFVQELLRFFGGLTDSTGSNNGRRRNRAGNSDGRAIGYAPRRSSSPNWLGLLSSCRPADGHLSSAGWRLLFPRRHDRCGGRRKASSEPRAASGSLRFL